MPLITRRSISRSISRPVRSISPSTTSSMAEGLPHGLEKTSLSSSCWVGIRISPDGGTIRLLSCAPAGAAVLRIASRAIDQRRTGILAPPLLVSPSTADQVEQLLLAQASARFRPLQELGCQVAFVAVQPHDPLLNAVLHDQPVDRHRPLLANPMRPIRSLVQFQRTCWWSSSRCSHLKCWCTRSMSSSAVNVRSGSTIARLPCSHRGSIGLSQGLFTGKRHTRIRTPPVRFTVRLCVLIHPCTAWLTCQVALSHTSTHTRLPSFANL